MLLPSDDVGPGSAVVLLHAGVADRTMWAEHLGPIADAGYRAVAMDLPEFGEAIPGRELDPWSDVLQTMDALGIDRAALVGNSFGGAVALGVAVAAPERVAALVLVSAPPPGLEPSSELQAAWKAEESALQRGDIDAAVRAVVDAWTLADAPAPLRDRVTKMQRRAFELQAATRPLSEAQDPVEADPAALGELEVPALVAAGEHDMPDFRLGAEALAHQLPQARHVVIAKAGHLAPLEQPARFRDLLLGFLHKSAAFEDTTR
ncbi:MAG: alpha/beta fold hydrolase [Solirubrobacteraceae bacterium]